MVQSSKVMIIGETYDNSRAGPHEVDRKVEIRMRIQPRLLNAIHKPAKRVVHFKANADVRETSEQAASRGRIADKHIFLARVRPKQCGRYRRQHQGQRKPIASTDS